MLSNHDVIRILVNIALFKQLIFVSWCIFYSILNIKFYIDVSFREKSHSKRCIFQIRSITRSHVLRFDFTLYFKSIRVSNLDSFVFAIFISMHDLDQNISRWKNLFENFKQRIAEKITSLKKSHRWKSFKTRRVEKVCTKISNWIR